MVVHLLQKCSSSPTVPQLFSPAGRQEQECFPLSAAAPAFLLLPSLIICFAICTEKISKISGFQSELSTSLQQLCTNLEENPQTAITSLRFLQVNDAWELFWTGAWGSDTLSLCVSATGSVLNLALNTAALWAPPDLRYFLYLQFFSFFGQPHPLYYKQTGRVRSVAWKFVFCVLK